MRGRAKQFGGSYQKKRKKIKKTNKRRKKEEEEKKTWGEPCVRGRGKREDFPAFRRSKLDSPIIKVGLRNESYTWVLKSERFVKLEEVGVFSYSVYFLLKSHSMAIWYSSKRRAGSRAIRNELWVI